MAGSLFSWISLFDGNVVGRFKLLRLCLWQGQLQHAVLIFGADILRPDVAHIEAALALTAIALAADIPAVLVLFVLIEALGGAGWSGNHPSARQRFHPC